MTVDVPRGVVDGIGVVFRSDYMAMSYRCNWRFLYWLASRLVHVLVVVDEPMMTASCQEPHPEREICGRALNIDGSCCNHPKKKKKGKKKK